MTPVLSGHPPDSLLECANTGLDRESKMRYQIHRRTGNFLPGGAVNHLPKKFSQVSQIFTKESKRNEAILQQHRPYWRMKWLDTVFQGQYQDHTRSTFVLIRVAMTSELSWHRNHAVTYFTSAKSKILGTGNLTKSFTGAFFANTVFSMFAKFKLNL